MARSVLDTGKLIDQLTLCFSNAYMYGFFKNKRIVLYDTLLAQMNLEEILAGMKTFLLSLVLSFGS